MEHRDKTLFFAHVGVSSVLGVFCGRFLLSLDFWRQSRVKL